MDGSSNLSDGANGRAHYPSNELRLIPSTPLNMRTMEGALGPLVKLVKTRLFHGCNAGSTPARVTIIKRQGAVRWHRYGVI